MRELRVWNDAFAVYFRVFQRDRVLNFSVRQLGLKTMHFCRWSQLACRYCTFSSTRQVHLDYTQRRRLSWQWFRTWIDVHSFLISVPEVNNQPCSEVTGRFAVMPKESFLRGCISDCVYGGVNRIQTIHLFPETWRYVLWHQSQLCCFLLFTVQALNQIVNIETVRSDLAGGAAVALRESFYVIAHGRTTIRVCTWRQIEDGK